MTANMRIGVISLGCSKNRVDTEHMLAVLNKAGYCITPSIDQAQVVIINTCAFIQSAKEESIDTILEMAHRKKIGKLQRIIVTGCLPQRYRHTLSSEIPEVDGWIGVNQYGLIDEIVNQVVSGRRQEEYDIYCSPPPLRMLSTPSHLAYVKIAEGCDHRCSYCAIPAIRGPYKSRPIEDIVRECRSLGEQGVKEIVLIAQDTSYYGKDLYGSFELTGLLRRLSNLDIPWIRIMYTYPERITLELLDVMEKAGNIVPYLDMPLQHINNEILRSMGRAMTCESAQDLLNRIWDRHADFTLRTTFISGFPNESEAQHKQLLQFIEDSCFDHVGIFAYSREEGTRAAELDGQVDEQTKTRRRGELLKAQRRTANSAKQARIGCIADVMVESVNGLGKFTGRLIWQAPEVDGMISIGNCTESDIGRIIPCRITRADAYDYWGIKTDDAGQ